LLYFAVEVPSSHGEYPGCGSDRRELVLDRVGPLVSFQARGRPQFARLSTNGSRSLSLEPATIAYNEALELFQTRFPPGNGRGGWLTHKTTMQDVHRAVDEARALYERNSKPSKARMWLEKLSKRVIFYRSVFDALTNGAPEYASFGWGALEFLCMVSCAQPRDTPHRNPID
jgi:hypothetical protein